MAAHPEQTILIRTAAICAALTLIAIPATYLLGLVQIGQQALHDTYYLTTNADRIGVIAAIAVAHQIGAMVCAQMAATRPSAARAGWVLSGSAMLLVAAEFAAVAIFTLTPQPQRYVDFFSPSAGDPSLIDLARVYDVVIWIDLVAVLGMAGGWILLAFVRMQVRLADI